MVVCGECGKGVDVRGGDTDGALAYHLAHNCRGGLLLFCFVLI